MFLKKSLLFTTALALLMFTGQAFAQPSISVKHVPGDGGTAGMASGQGTVITIEVSQTGVTQSVNAIEVVFEFDSSVLTLTDGPDGPDEYLIKGNKATLLSPFSKVSVPDKVSFTFTTVSDVTNMPFSIGVTKVQLDNLEIPLSESVSFNAGSTPPAADGASLSVGGNTIVRGKSAGDEIVVTVSASTVTGQTTGAEFDIVSDKVTIGSVNGASGLRMLPGTKDVTLVGVPTTLNNGIYGTVTLTVNAGVTADMAFSIGVANFVAYNADGTKTDVAAGAPLMVNKAMPTLTPDKKGDVMIPRDGSATVMVTADGFDGTVMFTGAADDGSVTATKAGDVKVSATDGIDPEEPEITVSFILTPIVTIWDGDDDATGATITVSHGATAMVKAIVEDAVDGADISFDVQGEGITSEEGENNVTVSATGDGSATITATVNGYTTEAAMVTFVAAGPEAVADKSSVTVPRGGEATATVSTVGFPEGATINYTTRAFPGVVAREDGGILTITSNAIGAVTVTATDGTDTTPAITINFVEPPPELMASTTFIVIPTGGTATVDITAVGFDTGVSYSINKESGTATLTQSIIDDKTVQLAASGSGSAVVTVSATDGTNSTEEITITFWEMPAVSAAAVSVPIPQPATAETEVMATGFPADSTVTFDVTVTSGSEGDVTHSQDGNVLTLTATGAVTVSVTATDGTTTTAPVTVAFTQDIPAAPKSLAVQDQPGDNGHYVMVSFANSADHSAVSQYRIYREMDANTEVDSDGNVVPTDDPMKVWMSWAVVDAVSGSEDLTRAVVPVTDGMATRWGVAARKWRFG